MESSIEVFLALSHSQTELSDISWPVRVLPIEILFYSCAYIPAWYYKCIANMAVWCSCYQYFSIEMVTSHQSYVLPPYWQCSCRTPPDESTSLLDCPPWRSSSRQSTGSKTSKVKICFQPPGTRACQRWCLWSHRRGAWRAPSPRATWTPAAGSPPWGRGGGSWVKHNESCDTRDVLFI